MEVLGEYHAALGDLIHRFEGTLERFTGDGLMVFFNDPIPCDDAPERAVRMAVAMRARVAQLEEDWRRRGHDLGFGVGIAQGHATLGRDRLRGALRLRGHRQCHERRGAACDEAEAGQILISQRVYAAAEDMIVADSVGELNLRGFSRPDAGLQRGRTRRGAGAA